MLCYNHPCSSNLQVLVFPVFCKEKCPCNAGSSQAHHECQSYKLLACRKSQFLGIQFALCLRAQSTRSTGSNCPKYCGSRSTWLVSNYWLQQWTVMQRKQIKICSFCCWYHNITKSLREFNLLNLHCFGINC